jgi:hypothetical protein
VAEIGSKNPEIQKKKEELGEGNGKEGRSALETRNLWIKTTKNSTNQEVKIRGNFGATFGFSEFMVEITNQEEIRGNQKLLTPYDRG